MDEKKSENNNGDKGPYLNVFIEESEYSNPSYVYRLKHNSSISAGEAGENFKKTLDKLPSKIKEIAVKKNLPSKLELKSKAKTLTGSTRQHAMTHEETIQLQKTLNNKIKGIEFYLETD